MVVVETHAGKFTECRYMVVGTVPLVQKGPLCIQLDSHRETQVGAWWWWGPCRESWGEMQEMQLHGGRDSALSAKSSPTQAIEPT